MTEEVYSSPVKSFAVTATPAATVTVPVLAQGRAALEKINKVGALRGGALRGGWGGGGAAPAAALPPGKGRRSTPSAAPRPRECPAEASLTHPLPTAPSLAPPNPNPQPPTLKPNPHLHPPPGDGPRL